jgi:hypothetical protein
MNEVVLIMHCRLLLFQLIFLKMRRICLYIEHLRDVGGSNHFVESSVIAVNNRIKAGIREIIALSQHLVIGIDVIVVVLIALDLLLFHLLYVYNLTKKYVNSHAECTRVICCCSVCFDTLLTILQDVLHLPCYVVC